MDKEKFTLLYLYQMVAQPTLRTCEEKTDKEKEHWKKKKEIECETRYKIL